VKCYLFVQDHNLTQQAYIMLMFRILFWKNITQILAKMRFFHRVSSPADKFRFVPYLLHDSYLQTLSNLTLINHHSIRCYIPSKTDIDDDHPLSPLERPHCTLIYICSIVIVSGFYFPQHYILSVIFSKPF
jgi:hypothetical protein